MSSKIRWDEFMQRRFDHLTVVNAINALDQRWHRQHSDKDGSEFTVEGLYSPHLDLGSRGVPVSIEDLGSTCLTQIAGFVAMVSLPFMPTTGTTGERIALEPPYLHHQWLREADWSGFVDSMWGWGTTSGPQEGSCSGIPVGGGTRRRAGRRGGRPRSGGAAEMVASGRGLARSALGQTRAIG
jgi:hypothetical protein